MKIYDIAKGTLYDSIILSLLKRNIISLDEAVNCLNDIDIQLNQPNDLNNNFNKRLLLISNKPDNILFA